MIHLVLCYIVKVKTRNFIRLKDAVYRWEMSVCLKNDPNKMDYRSRKLKGLLYLFKREYFFIELFIGYFYVHNYLINYNSLVF